MKYKGYSDFSDFQLSKMGLYILYFVNILLFPQIHFFYYSSDTYGTISSSSQTALTFESFPTQKLNQLFSESHNLIDFR